MNNRICISITFDDGWKSQYEYAMPLLMKYNLKATFYIISKHLSGEDPNYMNTSEVKALYNQGHEIGAHTVDHPNLYFSFLWNGNQIIKSKLDLEESGLKIQSFAYPYGKHNWFVRRLVKQAGYDNSRVVGRDFNKLNYDHYQIKGQVIEVNTKLSEVNTWVDHAIQKGYWLVLIFHRITFEDYSYDCTPTFFESVCSSLANNPNVANVTLSQGVENMPAKF